MNYIKIIQETLGVELKEDEMKKYEPNVHHLSDLANALKKNYQDFKMAEKDIGTFRPYISPRFDVGNYATLAYRSRVNVPDELKTYSMEETVKQLLLYAHEICLHDPLVYLLDYYRLDPGSKYSIDRIPVMKHILIELSRLKPLIDRNIIHIVSDEIFTGLNNWSLIGQSMDLKDIIIQQIGDNNFDNLVFGDLIKSLYEQVSLGNNVDLYFPTYDFIVQYKALLDGFKEKFTKEHIFAPLRIAELAGLHLVSTNQLSLSDLIHIRQEENVFKQWRILVKETLEELWKTKSDYSDNESEFKRVMNEQYQKLDLDILKQAEKSNFYSNIPKFKEKVSIGLVSSVILQSILPSDFAPSNGSLINAIFSAMLEQMSSINNNSITKRVRTAINKHFLILKE